MNLVIPNDRSQLEMHVEPNGSNTLRDSDLMLEIAPPFDISERLLVELPVTTKTWGICGQLARAMIAGAFISLIALTPCHAKGRTVVVNKVG